MYLFANLKNHYYSLSVSRLISPLALTKSSFLHLTKIKADTDSSLTVLNVLLLLKTARLMYSFISFLSYSLRYSLFFSTQSNQPNFV